MRPGGRGALRLEVAVLTMAAAVSAAAMQLATGYLMWSWDALNHHIYLGLIAESSRWDLDVVAASFQGYQYPYLYWPIYRLSLVSGSGAVMGAAWSAFQVAMLTPPLWLACKRLLGVTPRPWVGVAERTAGCVLAGMSAVVLTAVETTGNDLLCAVPVLWAVAIALREPANERRAAFAALLVGASIALKLSNVVYLPLLLAWWFIPFKGRGTWRHGAFMCIGCVAGFTLTYAPWGWQLWRLTGNPFYPFMGRFFGGA